LKKLRTWNNYFENHVDIEVDIEVDIDNPIPRVAVAPARERK
jgi:hypothetical protein